MGIQISIGPLVCFANFVRSLPPANAFGAWTSRGISDWNHGTEMLKLHNKTKWHQDAVLAARMAEQQSVLELQHAAAARNITEKTG